MPIATLADPIPAKRKVASWPLDCTVIIVAPFPPPYGGMSLQAEQLFHRLIEEGVNIKRVATTQKLTGQLAFIERIVGLRTLAHFAFFLLRIWQAARPNTVFHIFSNSYASFFLWTAPTVLIGKMRGAPVIINYRGGLADEFLQKWRMSAVWIFRSAAKVIVPSGFLQAVFAKYGIAPQVISNFVVIKLPPPSPRSDDVPHIVVNRNFEEMYNIACALRAFALIQKQITKARLTLIGEGTQRGQLESLVAAMTLQNVKFTGKLDNQTVLRTLQHGDVMLNPTNVDNMPISVIEAMALGLPIVSTNVGGIPYLLTHEVSGLLVEKNDHSAMAQAALRILQSSSLRQRLAENAKRVVDDLSWGKTWPQWRALYSHQLKLIIL